jgi:hypothetical protein
MALQPLWNWRLFQFLNPYILGTTLWTGDQPVAKPLPTHRTTQTEETHTDIHASSGIRTYDPNVRAGEDGSCLRQRGRCDRLHGTILGNYSATLARSWYFEKVSCMPNACAFSECFKSIICNICHPELLYCTESKSDYCWELHFQQLNFTKKKSLKFRKAGLFTPPGSLMYNNGFYHWQSIDNELGFRISEHALTSLTIGRS